MRWLGAAAALLMVGAAACAPAQPAKPGFAVRNLSSPTPRLATAIEQATRLGPSGADTQVDLSLGLKVRQPDRLARLLASGQTVSPETYAAEFGADPARVQAALGALTAGGLHATWRPGSGVIAAGGPAPAAAALFKIDIESYRLANGTTFYAALEEPSLPA